MDLIYEVLENQGVSQALLRDMQSFRRWHSVPETAKKRILAPQMPYYGKEILEVSIASLLQGQNILLVGSKATGKNVLAENLAWLFQRPMYNVSFHVNTDSSSLIGTDTFRNQEVVFRPGPIYQCAVNGGFGVLDEINMAKNDAAAVLHATLDYRRMIDVPGYDRIELHDATRFIGTMNYGYAGTRELNEALVSRFLVIDMPELTEETMTQILKDRFPQLKDEAAAVLVGLFLDLQLKARNSEISTKALDMRGLIGAIRLMQVGIAPQTALRMGMVNKSFDSFEKDIVGDILMVRIPEDWKAGDIFD